MFSYSYESKGLLSQDFSAKTQTTPTVNLIKVHAKTSLWLRHGIRNYYMRNISLMF